MCLMQHLPKINKEYLKVIIGDKELYKEAAVEVKQQIWQDHQSLFGDEVSPILTKYIEDKETSLFSHESLSENFFSPSPKVRRQGDAIQQLTKMVGKSIKLYDMVLQFLRTLFLRTRNVHYCTLRAEILMTLHDNDVHEICTVDPCHKFTWCLDACIRERFVDSKRARELQAFLDGVRRGQEQVLGFVYLFAIRNYILKKNYFKLLDIRITTNCRITKILILLTDTQLAFWTVHASCTYSPCTFLLFCHRDLAMILCDPYAVSTIAMSAIKIMQQSVNNETVPRVSNHSQNKFWCKSYSRSYVYYPRNGY